MRLLEFNRDEGGANPRRSKGPSKKPKPANKPTRSRAAGPQRPVAGTKLPRQRSAEVLPLQGQALRKPARQGPVDLEQLQQRIDFLERRVQEESRQSGKFARVKDLEQLRKKLQKLENNLENELLAAHDREDRMLAVLNRPPLKTRIRDRGLRFWREERPVILAWIKRAADSWWQDSQPGWWPRFAAAWRESLEKARR